MIKTIFAFLLMLSVFARANAGESKMRSSQPDQTGSGFYAGALASTNGLGLDIQYMINKRFTLKAGYETLNFNHSFNLTEDNINYDTNLNYKTGGISILMNWFYRPALYLSGGVIINKFQPVLEGEAVSDMEYGDISIPAEDVGDFNFQFESSVKTSPYIGAGFRNFFGKQKRITYNFETGLYYMGPPEMEISARGLLSPSANPAHGHKNYLEDHFSVYKFYPVVKLAIAVRLF
jgi:hypothetical protein